MTPAHVRATVVSRRDVTPSLWAVRVLAEERLAHAPGQYFTIGLPFGGKLLERPYSIVSAPHEDEIEFFVELVGAGQFTPLFYEVPIGGEVWLRRAPKGRFLLNATGERPQLFVSTVTGVAPYLSFLRRFDQVLSDPEQPVVLLHGAGTSDELGYHEELTELAGRAEWFTYVPTISRPWLDPAWTGECGRVDDVLRKVLDAQGWAREQMLVYACGHPQMSKNAKAIVQRLGLTKDQFHQEQYWVERPSLA